MKIIIKIILLISLLLSITGTIQLTDAAKINVGVDLSQLTPDCHTDKTCTVNKGTTAIMNVIGGIIKYMTFIVGLLGVLFIVVNGIMYSMGGMDQSMKDESKKRIIKTLIGLIFLLMTGVILNLIAPWVYR